MASFSINTLSLYSHSKFQNPEIKTLTSLTPLKNSPSITAIHLPNSLTSFNLKLKSRVNHHSRLLTHSTKSPNPQEPFSNNTNFFTPFKNLAVKIVIVLLGSFVFIGFVNRSPVLAPQESNSKKLEHGEIEDEKMYAELLKQNPRNVEALKVILNLKMKRGKTEEAVEYVEKLIDIEPYEVDWRLLEALCYEMMGKLSKAKKLFKEILKQRPLLLKALHGLAMVMHKNREGLAVFEMLNKALEIARREKRVVEERNIRILIAQMHVVKGELEDGLKQFQELIDENPRDFRPYLCQGIIYSLLDKKTEAEKQFEIYKSLVPEEFPQRDFLDDVVLAAKTESREKLEKDIKDEIS